MEPGDGEGLGDENGIDIEKQLEENEFTALMGMSLDEILREGQKALFARLVGRCRLGLASHQELAILRNVIKDNGVTLGIPVDGDGKPFGHNGGPPMDLPTFGEPEYD